MNLTKDELLRNLRNVQEKYKDKTYKTFELNIYAMVSDVIDYLENDHFESSETRVGIRGGTRGQCKTCESKFLKGISDVEKEVDKYRIALDKACLLLNEATRQVYDIFDEVLEEDEYSWITETEEWKRYLLDEIN